MSLSQAFLDELRARTSLSGLIGRSIKIVKAGREFKAICPFHSEKTPSFTINDEKGFFHCFSCGAHGDAIRWLTDYARLDFIDAVRDLAAAAGLEMPERSPEAAARAAAIDGLRPAVEATADFYYHQLREYENVAALDYLLNERGLTIDLIDQFGIGFAPPPIDNLKPLELSLRVAVESGLAWRDKETGRHGARFRSRIMIPVHDARGRVIGFGGRDFASDVKRASDAKYINSPDSPIFDKGRVLFNLHRAAPLARAKPGTAGRLVIVEGYFDVIAMSAAGIGECVAPMGTALTAAQLEAAWRVHPCPTLLFDGDAAGRKAAKRACETALAFVGPGKSLRVAMLPDGQDPDDILRGSSRPIGIEIMEGILALAKPIDVFLFEAIRDDAGLIDPLTPEEISQIWQHLEQNAGQIEDIETRAQYFALWRSRFDREISGAGGVAQKREIRSFTFSDDGDFAWPDDANESERRLLMILQQKLEYRAQRRAISQEEKALMAMAKAIGFDGPTITRICSDIEADASAREGKEALYATYRRVAGIKGPVDEALLPAMRPMIQNGVMHNNAPAPKQLAAPKAPSVANALAWADVSNFS